MNGKAETSLSEDYIKHITSVNTDYMLKEFYKLSNAILETCIHRHDELAKQIQMLNEEQSNLQDFITAMEDN